MSLIKQIFCNHIYKNDDKTFLRTERKRDGGISFGAPTYSNYIVYSIKQECLKCGKNRIIEKSYLDIF